MANQEPHHCNLSDPPLGVSPPARNSRQYHSGDDKNPPPLNSLWIVFLIQYLCRTLMVIFLSSVPRTLVGFICTFRIISRNLHMHVQKFLEIFLIFVLVLVVFYVYGIINLWQNSWNWTSLQ